MLGGGSSLCSRLTLEHTALSAQTGARDGSGQSKWLPSIAGHRLPSTKLHSALGEREPSSAAIEPLMRFFHTCKCVSLVSNASVAGNVPLSEFAPRPRYVSLLKRPICGGMVPDSPSPYRMSWSMSSSMPP